MLVGINIGMILNPNSLKIGLYRSKIGLHKFSVKNGEIF
jgi:hypothetical protein